MTSVITSTGAVTTGFAQRPAWQVWRDQVVRDIKRSFSNRPHASAAVREALELRDPENLLSWLRALQYQAAEVEMHIGDARLRLLSRAPTSGTSPTTEYLELKREHDELHAIRVRFHRAVQARIEECRYLIDLHGVATWTPGETATRLTKIEDLLMRDDIDAALGLCRAALSQIERRS